MRKPTEEEAKILRANGWVISNGGAYNCRYCHRVLSNSNFAWFSPKLAGYHQGCILQSKQVQKLLENIVGLPARK